MSTTAVPAEIAALDPVGHPITLSGGLRVSIQELRSRQFFKLLRIVTHGAADMLASFQIKPDDDALTFGTKLITMVCLSIPDAEDETVAFLQSMVQPVGLATGRRLNKLDTERNDAAWQALTDELDNPRLEDLVTLIEAIVRANADDLQALGKRLMALFKLAVRTGQVPDSMISPTPTSSADSPAPSTSSAPSTDGPTTWSPTSPSDDSASTSPRSPNGTG